MCVKVIASQRWDVFLRHGVHIYRMVSYHIVCFHIMYVYMAVVQQLISCYATCEICVSIIVW